MKKKEFLTEAKRKAIIADKEKAILESFAKTFNKIKRIDENEISEAVTAEDKLNELIGKPISLIRTLHTRGKYNQETGERPKVTEDEKIDGFIGEIVNERAAKGFKVMNPQGGKIAFLMYDKDSGSFIEGDWTLKYTYKGVDETSKRILQFILRYLVGVNENELDMGEISRQHRSGKYGINLYQKQPELSDLGQLTPDQEEMKNYISKYVNSELELNHEMSNYINNGYQGLSDSVKQGLDNDMDYQTWVQIQHDEDTFRRERGF